MIGIPTKDYVLSNVDQLFIMRCLVTGAKEGGFRSPFRHDKGPGCWLNWYNNILYYHDPKDTIRTGKDIIQLWSIQYNVTYERAKYQILKKNGNLLPNIPEKTTKYFGYGLREWQDYDEDYFGPYDLNIDDLESGTPGLFPAEFWEYQSKRMGGLIRTYSTSDKPLYVYIWTNGKAKGYAPLSKQRFYNGCTAEEYYYYPVKDSGTLLICASGKDAKVVTKQAKISTLAMNGETYRPETYPLGVIKSYNKVIVGLDNDSTGIKFSNILLEYLVSQGINAYICLPKTKDWARDQKRLGKITI